MINKYPKDFDFIKIVSNKLRYKQNIECIVMTDEFYDYLCHKNNHYGFCDFRRIQGIPLCVVPNGELKENNYPNNKIKLLDYKFFSSEIIIRN